MCTALILVELLVLCSATTAVFTPSYEVPHPAVSAAAISQGKGGTDICKQSIAALQRSCHESQMNARRPNSCRRVSTECCKPTTWKHARLGGGGTSPYGSDKSESSVYVDDVGVSGLLAGHLSRLEDLAQQEGYLTRIWRSNCFTSALEHLGITHCQSMSPEQKSRWGSPFLQLSMQPFYCHHHLHLPYAGQLHDPSRLDDRDLPSRPPALHTCPETAYGLRLQASLRPCKLPAA